MNEIITEYLRSFFYHYEIFAIIFLFCANSSFLLLLIFGYVNSRRKYAESFRSVVGKPIFTKLLRPISMIAPCYNEESSIADSIRSLLRLNYPEFEVVVINDGSKDRSMSVMIKEFQLIRLDLDAPNALPSKRFLGVYRSAAHPNLLVIDKENGGKADALNAGINWSRYPLVCCIDADSIIDEQGLMRMALPFFEQPEKTVAVGGVIRVVNGSKVHEGYLENTRIPFNYWALIQVVEYIRSFLVGRMGWDYLNCNTIISGAFGLFKKDIVIRVGGYGFNTIGEDLELLLRIHRYCLKEKQPYAVHFLPTPICWTEVPSNFKALGNQRSRWQQGLMEGLWQSRDILFRPWGKQIGMLALPYLLFFELLSAPLELFTYVVSALGLYFRILNPSVVCLFLFVSIFYGAFLTLGAIFIEEVTFRKYDRMEDFLKLLLGIILEQLGYHQIHLFWRVRGMWRCLRGTGSWGKMDRVGFRR